MRTRARSHTTAILALLLPLLLVAGLWLGGHPEDLPGFVRSTFVADQQTRVIDEAIHRIMHDYYRPVSAGQLSDASIAGAISSLGDRYSHYLTPREYSEFNSPPHFTGIGVAVGPDRRGLLIAHVFDSSPAARAGLKSGEVIVSVNGRSLRGVSADNAIALIKGLPGTNVRLVIEGPGRQRRPVTITRATIDEPVVASLSKTADGRKIGVVALATFSPGAHGEVREAVEQQLKHGASAIVLDLRGNGGGLVEEAQLVSSIFVPKGTIVTMRGRTQPTQTLVALGDAIPAKVPVDVLVDSGTASAAEIVTAALQDHGRARVIGTHTYGKGVFQEEEMLANGGAIDITVGEYFTPNGRNLGGGGVKQGAGITPEVAVPASVVDTDRGLQAALQDVAARVR
jgi:carboxyl-terminal processing protease